MTTDFMPLSEIAERTGKSLDQLVDWASTNPVARLTGDGWVIPRKFGETYIKAWTV